MQVLTPTTFHYLNIIGANIAAVKFVCLTFYCYWVQEIRKYGLGVP